jgi:hypothetical protein
VTTAGRTAKVLALGAACGAGVLAGGCAEDEAGGRYFQPDDDGAVLKNVLAQEFPRGTGRDAVRARAAELDLSLDAPMWARAGDAGAFWPVPEYGPSGGGPIRWASTPVVMELSGTESDFFEIRDDRPQHLPWGVTCALRTIPRRGMVIWYDGAGGVDGVLVGPLVYSMSDKFEGDGFWVHERGGGRTW